MSKRKDKVDEEKVAAAGPTTGADAVSPEHDEPQAAELVEGDDRGAAVTEGAQHADGASPADAGSGDVSDGGRAGGEGVADGPVAVIRDGAATDADGRSADVGDDDLADLVTVTVTGDDGDQGAGAGSEGVPLSFLDLQFDELNRSLLWPNLRYRDKTVIVSDGIMSIAHEAGSWAHHLEWLYGTAIPTDGLLSLDIAQQLYPYIGRIGERATPDVLAQQMVILRHRETAELTWPERVTLDVFISVSLAFLRREDEIKASMNARMEAERAKPAPVPIEDTTMEPVSDTLETW
jgi:hypothetical protein